MLISYLFAVSLDAFDSRANSFQDSAFHLRPHRQTQTLSRKLFGDGKIVAGKAPVTCLSMNGWVVVAASVDVVGGQRRHQLVTAQAKLILINRNNKILVG